MSKVGGSDSKNTLYCSFCGKSQHEVRKLIAGPTVFICDECVELCMDIIREENKSSLVKSRDGIPTPKEIRKVFNKRIDINGVYDFEQKSLSISRAKGKTTIEVDYEIKKEMVGNVSVVMAFYKKVEM